jgi:hypothetical protein
LPALARAGGAILEPWLERDRDLSAQLHVSDSDGLVVLGTLEQRMSRRGSILGHRGEIDSRGRIFSGLPEDEDLREAAAGIAASAQERGYSGPCGVDAFTFLWPDETEATSGTQEDRELRRSFRPVVELNARFTMGTVTIGLVRRYRSDLRQHLGLRPGDRCAFELRFDAPRNGWEAARSAAGEGAFIAPLHQPGDRVHPAVLFAASRDALERAIDDDEPTRTAEGRTA